MNKTVFYIILVLLPVNTVAQQNLVPNPSFEDTISCPNSLNDFNSIVFWYNPTISSPDIYHSCVSGGGGVPYNNFGFQVPKEGESYVGIVTYVNELSFTNYREYISVKLIEPLIQGRMYYWCISISLLDSTDYASNNLGIKMSNNVITSTSDQNLGGLFFYDNANNVITEDDNWSQIGGSFTAIGNENYLTIGNFSSDNATLIEQVQMNSSNGQIAYYYIDNVYLGETPCVESSIEIPNVFTPNNDGVNDYFFTTDSGIKDKTIRVLNRWGNLIFEGQDNDAWDGQFNNAECIEGVYFYSIEYFNIELNTKEQKTGFIQLVR